MGKKYLGEGNPLVPDNPFIPSDVKDRDESDNPFIPEDEKKQDVSSDSDKSDRTHLEKFFIESKIRLGECGKSPKALEHMKKIAKNFPLEFLKHEVTILEKRIEEGDGPTGKKLTGKDNPLVPKGRKELTEKGNAFIPSEDGMLVGERNPLVPRATRMRDIV